MQETSSSLVRGIRDFRDHQRWFEFQRLYRPMIRKILRDKGLPLGELDDVVQEVYLALLGTLERFEYDRSRGRFRSWIAKITQRAASARRRRRSSPTLEPRQLDEAWGQSDPPLDPRDDRVQLCLEIARSRFDDRTWLPFYLQVMEGTPTSEIEKITRQNRNAIYQAVHRVKRCLRAMLADLDAAPYDRGIDE